MNQYILSGSCLLDLAASDQKILPETTGQSSERWTGKPKIDTWSPPWSWVHLSTQFWNQGQNLQSIIGWSGHKQSLITCQLWSLNVRKRLMFDMGQRSTGERSIASTGCWSGATRVVCQAVKPFFVYSVKIGWPITHLSSKRNRIISLQQGIPCLKA